MTPAQHPRPDRGTGPAHDRTRRLPSTTQRLPLPPTRQLPASATEILPASATELLPESPEDGPTRAMRQVRARTEDGHWPAIPMLPVIRPGEGERISEEDRIRGHRGMQELRETVERLEDPDVPAWPPRERREDDLEF